MKIRIISTVLILSVLISITIIAYLFFTEKKIGDKIDELNGIAVYNNGYQYHVSHGTHYAPDGYYYGKKWQCVEFVKRYYHDCMHHQMPDGMGHAKDFFDKKIKTGEKNRQRNLLQFYNGSQTKPAVNDILVFDGTYGHVCIISKVSDDEIEVVQQNIFCKSRQTFQLSFENGNYTVGNKKKPLGWLHKP